MPVKGKILSFFGKFRNTTFNTVNFRNGIEIKTDMGEPIRAVGNGKIIFSGWLKGYGNLMIINHGQKYYTVYGHIEEFFKKKGATVAMDEIVASVGDTGSIIGPNLYFEIRRHGKPVDPMKWISKR